MSETTLPPTSTPPQPAAAPAPAPAATEQPVVAQVSTTPTASVTATAAAATAAVNSSLNGAGEQLPCQWVGCTEKCPSAEALYVSDPTILGLSKGLAILTIGWLSIGTRLRAPCRPQEHQQPEPDLPMGQLQHHHRQA